MDVRSVLKTVRGPAAAVVLGAALAMASGCAGFRSTLAELGGQSAPTISVGEGGVFNPGSLTVQAGDAVTWSNVSSTMQVVAGDRFGSAITVGGSFSHTFLNPGTYPFTAANPNISGLIIVE